jgi:dephospho-CoA kinase
MYKVGITGGIGTGKSTVCRIFSFLGIPIYDADSRAKWLTENNEEIRAALIAQFGEPVFTGSILNRTYLASVAFKDARSTNRLNSIIHPAVAEDFISWSLLQTSALYVLKEAALFYEAGTAHEMDAMIVVTAPIDLRMKRILKRDSHRTESQIKEIIMRQWPEDKKIALADYVLVNDEHQLLIPQVLAFHEQIIKQALL